MPDQVKTSVSAKALTTEELLAHVQKLTEMCVKHRDAWNRFVAEGGAEAFKIGMVFASTVATDPSVLLGYGTWAAFGSGRTLVGLDAGQTEFDTVEETGGAKTHTLVTSEMPVHSHTQDSHNHTQDSHNHTQNSHNHTQDSHNHTQNAHSHTMSGGQTDDTTVPLDRPDAATSSSPSTLTTATDTTVATNQATTATNQAATATNIAATATNQATTATNQSTGGDGAHNNLQPYIVVYFWKRTA